MYSLNVQPTEKPTDRGDGALDVVDIWKTIQGEGPLAGYPAVFVRLAGCNLQCPGCDTDYTSNRKMLTPEELWSAVDVLMGELSTGWTGMKLLVLTGGEPFRQRLGPFCRLMTQSDWWVQIETNGTLFQEDMPWYGRLRIVCSPKTPKIHDDLKRYVNSLKYVLRHGQVDADGLPTRALDAPCEIQKPWRGYAGNVFVQPMDELDPAANAANLQAAVQSSLENGHRLSLQLHKLCGLK